MLMPIHKKRVLLYLSASTIEGFNMSSLSRASNISFNTIKRLWTRPYGGANINTLDKIARVLGVPISELTGDVEENSPMVDAPKRALHGLILLDLFAYAYPLITPSYSETLK